jgi:NAD(P)-dependent dehydrogenase (short-subunit alcohol dehydrogenase family)
MSHTSRSFGAETTAEEAIQGIDLRGRVAIVTGASGGLGAESARVLAGAGAQVTLGCRDVEKGERVAASIREALDHGEVLDDGMAGRLRVEALDLLSFDSVRSFAKRFLADHDRLHLLLNNAGVMACPFERTPEGHELQFQTNHLGHFLLTGLLLPALRAGAPARIVNVSSAGHRFSPVVFDDVAYDSRPYDKWEAYGQAKTANVLHAVELDRLLRDQGVRAFALHPGGIVTELGRHLDEDDLAQFRERARTSSLTWKSVEAGAATSIFAATAPELEGRGGLYLEDCQVAQPAAGPDVAGGIHGWATDPEAAIRLWSLSEQMVGESFDLS